MTIAASNLDGRAEKGKPVAERSSWSQQPVISIRISDALRSRLEQLKEALSKKSGENVSTSEVAKQLLESAREDRLEVAELLADATVALAGARQKAEAGLSLSRAEWIVLAYYIRQGVESHIGGRTPPAMMKEILEAFLAAYGVRRGKQSGGDTHYLSNLPVLNKEGQQVFGVEAEGIDLPTAVERLIRRLKASDSDGVWPQFAARNLYEFLEEESFGTEAMNQALKPHWPVLWRAAARGHYLVRGYPVRDASRSAASEHMWGLAISSVFEGGFVLSFAAGSEHDLSVLLSLPEARQAMYEIGPYPMIAEFRAMLQGWDTSGPNSFWRGRWFFGYTAVESTAPPVWIRCQGAVSFGFTAEEWASLQEAFRRAWEMPELQRISGELMLQYGEI
jgi:hypothetical protein